MAFNPFNFFRKYQKVVFGIMAIICMLVFVLQFGSGDPFSWAMSRFGGGNRVKGSPVATLYGKKVYEGELGEVQYHRQIATDFLFRLLINGQQRVSTQEQNRDDPTAQPLFVPAADKVLSKLPLDNLGGAARDIVFNAKERSKRFFEYIPPEMRAANELDIRNDIDKLRNAMLFTKGANEAPSAFLALDTPTRDAFYDLLLYLQCELYMLSAGSNYGDLAYGIDRSTNKTYYMGGGRTTEDLLDFLVWRQQADNLGIHPNESAILRMIYTYTGNKSGTQADTFAKDSFVQSFLQARQERDRISAAELQVALRDEFRVALAREALTGRPAPGTFPAIALNLLPTTPAQPSSPEAFLEFQRLTTSQRVALLEIPVQAFLDKLEADKSKPTEAELLAMFRKYQDDEPNPDRSRPAFKEPRKVKVQVLHVSGETPFIREQAKRARVIGDAMLSFGAAPSGGTLVGSPFLVAAAFAAPQADFPLWKKYEDYKKYRDYESDNPRNERPSLAETWLTWGREGFAFHGQRGDPQMFPVHDSTWMHKYALPGIVGNMQFALGAHGSPWVGILGMYGTLTRYEEGGRKWQMTQVLPGTIAGTFADIGLRLGGLNGGNIAADMTTVGLATLLPDQQKKVQFEEPVALAVIAPLLKELELKQLTASVRTSMLREAYTEIRKQQGKPEAEAKAKIEAFLKDRGLLEYLKSTPYAEDRFELVTEPQLSELLALCKSAREEPGRPITPTIGQDRLLELCLQGRGTYDATRWSPEIGAQRQQWLKMLRGQWSPRAEDLVREQALSDPNAVLVWRSEDRPEEAPRSLDDFVWDKDKRVKVREKVLKAWQLLTARRQAEEFAIRLRDEAKALKPPKQGVEATIQWLRDQKPGVFKELPQVGRFVLDRRLSSPTAPIYTAGQIPDVVIAKPRPDMIEWLMNNLKEVGDAAVVPDAPVRHWYVALSQTRDVPELSEFLQALRTNISQDGRRTGLNSRFYSQYILPVEEKAYEEKLAKRLRTEASREDVDGAGRWRIPAGVKTTYERSDAE